MVGARSDDTAALKWTIVEFLTSPALTTPIEPAMPPPGPTALLAMPAPTALPAMPAKTGTTNTLVPAAVAKLPLPPCGLKAGCGFNHSKTAEQLCPIHIEAMTEYSACHQPLRALTFLFRNYQHILKGELTIKAKDMPCFLYAHLIRKNHLILH
jgi:hypothetical protein